AWAYLQPAFTFDFSTFNGLAFLSAASFFLSLVFRSRWNQRAQSSCVLVSAVAAPFAVSSEIRIPSFSVNCALARASRRITLPLRNQETVFGVTSTAQTCQPEILGSLPLTQPSWEVLTGRLILTELPSF